MSAAIGMFLVSDDNRGLLNADSFFIPSLKYLNVCKYNLQP